MYMTFVVRRGSDGSSSCDIFSVTLVLEDSVGVFGSFGIAG